jgi:hypothetical protein
MNRIAELSRRLATLSFEVMESRDVVDGDMMMSDAWFLGRAQRREDGGLVWDLTPPDGEGPGDEPFDKQSWSLSTEDVALDAVALPWLDIKVERPSVEPEELERLAAFLSDLPAHDLSFRTAIAARASTANSDLIADIFEFLPPEALAKLFPGRDGPEAITGEIFAGGLKLSRIGFQPADGARAIIADYRFLTIIAPPRDDSWDDDEIAPTYNGLYDATGQVIAVFADDAGRIDDISHVS